MAPIYFAAVGDIHGDHVLLVERLDEVIGELGRPLDFVLQVGDFEPTRDEADLATIAGPESRRKLGSFHRVLSGELHYPSEVIFIGGNHEPYGWLEEFPEGGEMVPGIYYMGRAGVIERAGLRIAGLTGIHSPKRYELPIPEEWSHRKTLLKEPTYFREPHVERLLAEEPVDILLTHDWPSSHFGPFGNPQSRMLLNTLQPYLHFVGHMHRPARKRVVHDSGRETRIIALNHVGFGKGDIVVFRWDGEELEEVNEGCQ
ncbi:MAG: metallophosphoesterase [Chloroflexota bacterium]|nr:metallophosphoesterase [Chloroflexota bacterium]